jgi:manganese efflux pump family protein
MDAFSVAIASGLALGRVTTGQVLRMASAFGFFQFAMPVAGWLLGSAVAEYIAAYDHWIAFALLAYVGGKMIHESFSAAEERPRQDPTRGSTLLVLSVATSIDALAVGLSLAFLSEPVFFPALVIGVVAMAMTALGLRLGNVAGTRLGPWMERAGGLVLIAIGIKIVLEHTLG